MADEKRFENEDIQKGLEDFIDRELTLDYSHAGTIEIVDVVECIYGYHKVK